MSKKNLKNMKEKYDCNDIGLSTCKKYFTSILSNNVDFENDSPTDYTKLNM